MCESFLFSMLDITSLSSGALLLLSCFGVACVHVRVCSDKEMWVFCCCYFIHVVINCYLCISIYFRFLCWCHLCDSPTRASTYSLFRAVVLRTANCIEGSEEHYIHTEMLPYLRSTDIYDHSYLGHGTVAKPRYWSDTCLIFTAFVLVSRCT